MSVACLALLAAGLMLAGISGAYGQSVSVSLDRSVYPVPFGVTGDFESTNDGVPNTRSIFPIHFEGIKTAIHNGNLDSAFIENGDLTIYVRINDPSFDISGSSEDEIAVNEARGPVQISVSRSSDTIILATAGARESSGNTLTVGSEPASNQYEAGPIAEIAPDAGIFELALTVRYTDGPESSACPVTENYASPNSNSRGDSSKRFSNIDGNTPEGNFCILKGDDITVKYTSTDGSEKETVATFDLHEAHLDADKITYIKGSDMVLTLIEPDFDLDSEERETYTLDLIGWDSDDAELTMGRIGGHASVFDPEPSGFRETGDSTGMFQVVIRIPPEIDGNYLDSGEKIKLEFTDWGPATANYVGEESQDEEKTIHTSDYGATIELDQRTYTWTDKVYITISAQDHNIHADRIDSIGNIPAFSVMIATTNGTLDNYLLEETGPDTGIFTGTITLVGFEYDADGDSNIDFINTTGAGSGPVDGSLPATANDSIKVSFEYSEDSTKEQSSNIRWNVGTVEILFDGPSEIPRTGTLRVTDPDINLDPTMEEELEITFHSDSDTVGDDVLLTEIRPAAGIFEATVEFVSDSPDSHQLQVAANDTVFATYVDYTLPDSYGTSRDIVGTANMADAGSVVTPIPAETPIPAVTPETVPEEIPDTTGDSTETDSTTNTPDPPVTQTVDSSNWENGKVEWTESRYNAMTENGTFQVTDPDQNTNTNSPDSFGVNVRSDTDSAGITITVTETGDATGVFKGEVSFTLTDRSTDGTLLVSSGDTITGEYEDHTPEAPDTAKDRPSVTKTAAINVISVVEPDPNISIKLDKETYTWTDRVRIQITSSEHNTDERSRDEIGGTENPVRVATRGGHIDMYNLKETDLNTGVFAGELVLAGFAHDTDGNSSTGTGGNDVTDRSAGGSGPDKGVLPADNEDAVSVSFEYAEGKVIANNSAIQWNKGTVSWIGSNFTTAGNGTFRVIDPDMNLNPGSADSFEVRVRPESKSWTNLTVTETGEETGIFEGLVFFMTDDSADNTLEVSVGNKVTGQYMDHTLPEPHVITKSIEISDTLEITALIDTNSTDTNSTNTDSATTNSTGTNSTGTATDKAESSAEKAKDDTKTKSSDAKPKDTKPSDDDKPKDTRPADDAKPKDEKPASDSKPKADSKPTVDPKPKMDPKPTDGPDKPGCGPGTELVGGTCQAVRSPVSFVDWLFSWFR